MGLHLLDRAELLALLLPNNIWPRAAESRAFSERHLLS